MTIVTYGQGQLSIGKSYRKPMVDAKHTWHNDVGFLVLREATREEYLRQLPEHNTHLTQPIPSDARFYLVAMD